MDLEEEYREVIENYVDTVVEKYSGLETDIDLWDWSGLQADLGSTAMVQISESPSTDLDPEKLRDLVKKLIWESYERNLRLQEAQSILNDSSNLFI